MINKKGFSLIEILVVVLIVGILAALALPQYQLAIEKSKISRILPILKNIADSQSIYLLTHGSTTLNMEDLDITLPFNTQVDSSSETTVRSSYKLDNGLGTLTMYKRSSVYLVWNSGRGYTIDFYGTASKSASGSVGICYATAAGNFKDVSQRVCKAMGRDTGRTSSAGTPVYALDF